MPTHQIAGLPSATMTETVPGDARFTGPVPDRLHHQRPLPPRACERVCVLIR